MRAVKGGEPVRPRRIREGDIVGVTRLDTNHSGHQDVRLRVVEIFSSGMIGAKVAVSSLPRDGMAIPLKKGQAMSIHESEVLRFH